MKRRIGKRHTGQDMRCAWSNPAHVVQHAQWPQPKRTARGSSRQTTHSRASSTTLTPGRTSW
eukprot:CAMPEP_0205902690 /NCGR_PEP_ID=MMETSP1083-20121108/28351_1 /ASSEMBLY_ACC=CAM_ASM_000430 /TAXON_ID=97485 /ORGANISM="Prymnesium parvum, Strain Texoma1" /LENGTH=61 /DNA_ID=CAMNT_0053268305 /DNA_START=548 /DNA_END=730 /DNA_ORIENTATION=-